jgi:L-fuconolactonase
VSAAGRVDAHHHVWDPARRAMPWMEAEGLEPLRRPFGVDDLEPLAAAAGVTATVVVQTVSDEEETREMIALAASSPLVAGVVGWVDLTDAGVEEAIERLRARPGGEALRATRHQVHDEPDVGWLAREDVRRGLRAVADAGLVYDLLLFPIHLAPAAAAVRAVPEGRFVLDHLAKPPIAAGELEPWRGDLRALAALGNVDCKLSGMVTEADRDAWTTDDLRPYADAALDAFGPERVMFGSDWPVCTLASSYAGWVEAAEALTAGLSTHERDAVWGATARRAYGL